MSWVVERLGGLWGGEPRWELDEDPSPAEAGHLALDSSLAERGLGWRPAWDLEQALERVVEWHRAQIAGQDMRRVSVGQIERFAQC